VSIPHSANTSLTAEPTAPAIRLPTDDIRRALDRAVQRGWTEHTRRVARVAFLLAADTVAGLLGIDAVLDTWWLVSNDGLRPVPNGIPLVAMVLCIQPLALRVTGAYNGGRKRCSLTLIGGAMLMAALIGWTQSRLFGEISATVPNKTAYVYSAAL